MIKNIALLLLFINVFCSKSQVNLDFESIPIGTYSAIPGWTIASTGYASNNGYCFNYSASSAGTVQVLNTPVNLGAGTPSVVPNSPLGGNNVLHFIYSGIAASVGLVRVSQTINVTASNKILQYAYFLNLLGNDHNNCCQAHYFKIWAVDCSSNSIPCGSVAALPTTTLCSNTETIGMATTTNVSVYTPNWIIKSLDLTSYIGSCVTIFIEDGMCVPGGHFPDLYFDAKTSSGISTSSIVCNNNTATLIAAPSNSYSWAGPGGFTSNNQTVITTTAGVYTLTLGNLGCAGGPSQTVSVVFNNTPTVAVSASNPTVCMGAPSTLSVSGAGAVTYYWSNGAVTASTVVNPTVSSVYTITVNSGTCPVTNTIGVTVITCVDVPVHIKEAVYYRIFPNPSKGAISIQADHEETVFIYDQLGRNIREYNLCADNNYSVNMIGLSAGIYFASNKITTAKLIVLE